MAIDMKDVGNIAHLARLHLSAAEQQEVLVSITNILKVIDGMQALDTEAVEPLAHANDAAAQRLRDDIVTEPNQRDRILALAPSADKGLFLVPKVLD